MSTLPDTRYIPTFSYLGQVDGTGRVLTVGQIQFGSTIQSSVGGAEVGSSLIGLTEDTLGLRWAGGPIPQTLSE